MTLWFSTWKSYSTYLFFSLTLHTMSKQAVFHTCDQHTNTQTRANVHWTHSCERTGKRADREKEGQSVYWEINNTNTTVGVLSIQLVLVEQRKDNVKNTALFVHRTLGKHTITYKFIYLNVDEKKSLKLLRFQKFDIQWIILQEKNLLKRQVFINCQSFVIIFKVVKKVKIPL